MDNFFTNYFQKREVSGNSATGEVLPQAKGASFISNAVNVTSEAAALSVATWYRAVELRSNTMSQLVMEYQKRNDAAHGGNYEQDNRGNGKYINYLLQVMPNPTMTWPQLIKQAEQDRINQGNAVIFIERSESGEIMNFWLCSMATLNPNTFTYNITFNRLGGSYSLSNVPSRDVLHIRNTFSNDHGLTGISTLRYARKALTLAATNDKLVTDTAAKGMRQKLIVQEDKSQGFGLGRANKKELQKVTEQLDRDIADKDVILLNNIASVTPISTNLQQQEINQIRNFSVEEIARYHGTPLIMLMHPSNETYKTPEAATQEYLLRTIQPGAHDWEVEMNAKILGYEGYPSHRFHFNDDSLMRLDPSGRANIGKILIETGVKCVNELRADYDMPAVNGGDRHYLSTNLQPLDGPIVENNPQEGGEA